MQLIIKKIRLLDYWIYQIAKILLAIIIGVQMILVSAGVVWRYILNDPIIWVDEVASYLLVIVTFAGCHVAFIENKLAAVTILPLSLTGLKQKLLILFANLVNVMMLVLITYYGVLLCQHPAVTSMVTPVLQWPMLIFYSLLPFTMCLLLFHMILVVFDDWNNEQIDYMARLQEQIKEEVI